MGQLHARVYSQLPMVELVGVFDTDAKRCQVLAEKYQSKVVSSLESLAGQVQAVSIAAPTESHLSAAEPFLKRGVATLIEKPIAATSEQARKLLKLAKEHGTFIQVGHTERFNPAVVALRDLGVEPCFIEAVRVSPFPFRSMDVGAVLDLMIHDIDLVLDLVKDCPVDVQAVGAGVLGEHEDLADARLTFGNGCVAKLVCSRVALETRRSLKVFTDDLYIDLDLHKKTGFTVSKSRNAAVVKEALDKAENTNNQVAVPKWTDLIQTEPLDIQDREPMRLQLEGFVDCVRNKGQRPVVSGSDGAAAVVVAEQIVEAMKSQARQGKC